MSDLQFELVVPAYNEAKNLKVLIETAIRAAELEKLNQRQFNLVIVNNGSKDDSEAVLKDLKNSALGPWFRVVPVIVNQGYGYGIWQGLKSTSAPFIGWSHADLQCDPLNGIKAFKTVQSNEDKKVLVKGVRVGRSLKEIFVSRVFEMIASLILGHRFYEVNAQPKVFPRGLFEVAKNPPQDFAFDLYMLYSAVKNGYAIQTIEVKFPARIHGFSNWASTLAARNRTIANMIRYIWKLAQQEGRL